MHSSTSPMTTRPEPARSCASLPATFRAVRFFPVRLLRHLHCTHLFPASSEFASLMMTFAVFGAGFLMRPIGAIVLGAYIDKVGRRKGLIVTLSIMAAGTFLIVLIPLTKASGFGRRCWCCAGACCKASRRARSWAACPFIWPRSPRQAVKASTPAGSPAASRWLSWWRQPWASRSMRRWKKAPFASGAGAFRSCSAA